MRKIIKKSIRVMNQIRTVGLIDTVLFHTRPENTQMTVKIASHDIVVRARTTDLNVAIESLKLEYNFLDDLLPRDFNGLFVDAGGYIGTAAISFASRFPNAQVVSIEPSSENIKILRTNIAKFPNVYVRHAALGSVAGDTISLRNRSTGVWGFTIIKNSSNAPQYSELEDVLLTSLSEIKEELGCDIDFLKLDIEGAEKQIFEENDAALQEIPFVFIELHERIVTGCNDAFRYFSRNRWAMRLSREKFVSIQSDRDKLSILKQSI